MKALVVVNPVAGQGRTLKVLPKVKAEFHKASCQAEIFQTKFPGEATLVAKRAVREGYDAVVAVGGDGTISEIVNGVAGSSVNLGVIPTGTVDVFSREMKIPFQIHSACKLIFGGKTRRIDLGQANSRYFVLVAGVGIDAQLVKDVSPEVKRVLKDLAYPLTGIKTLLTYKPTLMKINLNGKSTEEGYFVVVGNARYYAGRFSITSKASISDGFLDVCIFKKGNLGSFVRYIQGVVRGKHLKYSDVKYVKVREVLIESSHPSLVQADGDLIGQTPMNFRVAPRALSVFAPD